MHSEEVSLPLTYGVHALLVDIAKALAEAESILTSGCTNRQSVCAASAERIRDIQNLVLRILAADTAASQESLDSQYVSNVSQQPLTVTE